MKFSLAVQTSEVQKQVPACLLSGTFEEKLSKASQLGVDGLELMTVDPVALDAQETGSLLERYGLKVCAVGSGAIKFCTGISLLNENSEFEKQAREKFFQLIDFAGTVQAPLVTVGSFRGSTGAKVKEGTKRLSALLLKGAEYAGERKIAIAVELLNRYETDILNNVDEGLSFLETTNHPFLGLLLDTYHMNIEEASLTKPFERAMKAGKLFHVHLGDSNRLAPGKGHIDFAAIVETLSKVGYCGYLSAELLAEPDGDTAAGDTVEYMKELFDVNGVEV